MSRNLRVTSEYRSDPSAGAAAPNASRPKPYVKPSARKQPGRRYGPAPRVAMAPRASSPSPMRTSARAAAYQRQNGRLLGMTKRQLRQLNRMSYRLTVAWKREYQEARSA